MLHTFLYSNWVSGRLITNNAMCICNRIHAAIYITLLFALFSCKKAAPDLRVNPSGVSLKVGETQQIKSNIAATVFAIEDTFYASVDATGVVTGKKVGETKIMATYGEQSVRLNVSVQPNYTFCAQSLNQDLSLLIGKTKSEVISMFPELKEGYYDNNGKPILAYETKNVNPGVITTLIYESIVKVSFNSNGKCNAIVIELPEIYLNVIPKVLEERYELGGKDGEILYYFNHKKNVMIGVSYQLHSGIYGLEWGSYQTSFMYSYVPYNQ